MNKQISGMRATYLVASELSKLGLIATTTSRNAEGADILVTDTQCKRVFSVQVKSAQYPTHFLLGRSLKVSGTHLYVFVHMAKKNPKEISYYIVPSRVVERRVCVRGGLPIVLKKDITRYKDKWRAFTH
jgi:hypothetical protein